jgi:hypothetical protein
MRRELPIKTDSTTPALMSSYSFDRPMPRARAASVGVNSNLVTEDGGGASFVATPLVLLRRRLTSGADTSRAGTAGVVASVPGGAGVFIDFTRGRGFLVADCATGHVAVTSSIENSVSGSDVIGSPYSDKP